MKKTILTIMIIFFVILVVATVSVYNYRKSVIASQEINESYKSYANIQILGSQLISIINRTIDINEQAGIEKDEDGLYIDNGENSIEIYVEFIYGDDTTTVQMEKIADGGTEAFVKVYSTASFQCTDISYHEKTNNVKSLTFTEISDDLSEELVNALSED